MYEISLIIDTNMIDIFKSRETWKNICDTMLNERANWQIACGYTCL